MVFSSFTFLFCFFPAVVAVYFLARNRTQRNLVLLVASVLFYAWGEPLYVFLILLSTINDYVFSNRIQKSRDERQARLGRETLSEAAKDSMRTKAIRREKRWFILSVIINLGLLGVFKYADFLIINLNAVLGTSWKVTGLPLPIGISFYTFQTMSYSIDVYMGKLRAQKSFLTLATYVALFPQLIAGPIVRYQTIERELEERESTVDDVADGIRRFILGLAKKVLIANPMGLIADTIFVPGALPDATPVLWLAVVAYTFQIYFDFSGYSDMAIGLGRVFGFHFLENFNYPYIARSITDFWRRWHISLGTWFRDYVYIPLGGNRSHQFRNITIVWFLTGLWHGASWNYVIWGMYYGILLTAEKLLKDRVRIPALIGRILTLLAVMCGWTIFRLENLSDLRHAFYYLWNYRGIAIRDFITEYDKILFALPIIPIACLASLPWRNVFAGKAKGARIGVIKDLALGAIFLLTIVFLAGSGFNPFIYFRF